MRMLGIFGVHTKTEIGKQLLSLAVTPINVCYLHYFVCKSIRCLEFRVSDPVGVWPAGLCGHFSPRQSALICDSSHSRKKKIRDVFLYKL